MNPTLKKIHWREAATGGLWLGIVLCGITVLGYLTRANASLSWLTGALNFLLIVGFILRYGRRMSSYYGPTGFSFIQSVAFTLKMMMFAGIIAGLGQFIMQTYVDPAYYRDIMGETLSESGFNQQEIDLTLTLTIDRRSPILMIFSGVFSMLLYGGLIGVVMASFLRRPPYDPRIGTSDPESSTPPSQENPTSNE